VVDLDFKDYYGSLDEPAQLTPSPYRRVERPDRLGGLLLEYRRAAKGGDAGDVTAQVSTQIASTKVSSQHNRGFHITVLM
jgi:hypothetical protein